LEAKRQCQFRGEGCLREFQLSSGQGGSNRKYCEVCQKLAAKKRSAAHRASEDPERLRKRHGDQRRRKAAAAGRPYREMTAMRACQYRDRAGKRGVGCLGEFMPASGIQIYCDNCWKLARNDRQRVAALALYHADSKQRQGPGRARHEKRLQRGRKSAAAYHARQRERAAQGKILLELKSKPVSWRLIVPLLLLDPSLTKARVQELAGKEAALTPRQMTRLRAQLREWYPQWPGFGAKTSGGAKTP
jgi:hypothetical protein